MAIKTKKIVAKKRGRPAKKQAVAMPIAGPADSKRFAVSPEEVKMVRDAWEPWRANHILSIMRSDGIEYARAVKRSRRRLIEAGKWA